MVTVVLYFLANLFFFVLEGGVLYDVCVWKTCSSRRALFAFFAKSETGFCFPPPKKRCEDPTEKIEAREICLEKQFLLVLV